MESSQDLLVKIHADFFRGDLRSLADAESVASENHRTPLIHKIHGRRHHAIIGQKAYLVIFLSLTDTVKIIEAHAGLNPTLIRPEERHHDLHSVWRKSNIHRITGFLHCGPHLGNLAALCIVKVDPGHIFIGENGSYHALAGNFYLFDREKGLKLSFLSFFSENINVSSLLIRHHHGTLTDVRDRTLHAKGTVPERLSISIHTGDAVGTVLEHSFSESKILGAGSV